MPIHMPMHMPIHVSGRVDIAWFSFFLTSIGMFFWIVIIAKITKRLDPQDESPDSPRRPLTPKRNYNNVPMEDRSQAGASVVTGQA